ncbi:putative Ig domain-containing protein, partial [Crocosphaera watsonii]|uniref:putative Ig domain-containing protein n=1 Tax=Crocosphaera watsonii TaxID=263511 RepID=UPI0034DCD6EF
MLGNDSEGDTLTYFSNLLPGGSTLDPNTGEFKWTPTYFQAGDYEIPLSVSDGESVSTETVTISV